MQFVWFVVCAFLFSAGDYYSSLGGTAWRYSALGAFVGGLGYFVFAYLSRTTPLATLGGYINGAVVLITCGFFGWYVQGNKLSPAEWLWLGVIFTGIVGLAYTRS